MSQRRKPRAQRRLQHSAPLSNTPIKGGLAATAAATIPPSSSPTLSTTTSLLSRQNSAFTLIQAHKAVQKDSKTCDSTSTSVLISKSNVKRRPCCSKLVGKYFNDFVHDVPLSIIAELAKELKGLTIVDANTGCGCNLAAILYKAELMKHVHHTFAAEPRANSRNVDDCIKEDKLRYESFAMTCAQLHDYIAKEMKVDMSQLGLVICYPYPGDDDAGDYAVLVRFQPRRALILAGWYVENGQNIPCSGSVRLWNECLGPLRQDKTVTIGAYAYRKLRHAKYKLENGKKQFDVDVSKLPDRERHLYFECFVIGY